jgi:predicted nucleotidyltransferase
MNIQDDFKEFLRLLKKYNVEFVIVGGYAVAFHGYIRTTNDMDIFFRNTSENIHQIEKALIEFGFTEGSFNLDEFYDQGSIIRMGVPPVRIELINAISGLTFDQVWENKISGNYGDLLIFYIGFNELIKNKRASGRPKDLLDIDELGATEFKI